MTCKEILLVLRVEGNGHENQEKIKSLKGITINIISTTTTKLELNHYWGLFLSRKVVRILIIEGRLQKEERKKEDNYIIRNGYGAPG